MNKIIVLLIVTLIFIGCKKKDSQSSTDVPTTPFISYFSDTSSNKQTGGDTAKTSELQSVPFLEDIDTSLIQILGKVSSLPSSWTLNVPSPSQQGNIKSCTGWAVGYGMLSQEYKYKSGSYDFYNGSDFFSPMYIYNKINGQQNVNTTIPAALNIVMNNGCCKVNYGPNPNDYQSQPSAVAETEAQNYKILKWTHFKNYDIDKIKFMLHRGYTLPFLASVDIGFKTGKDQYSFDKKADGRLVWKNYNSLSRENHAMLICGYDDAIHAFKILNSWGANWGNAGYAWIDYDFLALAVRYWNGHPEIYLGIPPLQIGDHYQGGIVFYIDNSREHGLLAAPMDQSTAIPWWNGSFITTGASGYLLGTGQSNTNIIVNAQGPGSYAASICDNLILNNYDDWYLPSFDELDSIWFHRNVVEGFGNYSYWTSTEASNSPNNALHDAGIVVWLSNVTSPVKSTPNAVRAIRSF